MNEINVDISQLQDVSCPTCRKKVFDSTYEIKYLPALLSPNNRPGLIKVPVNLCRYCGALSTDDILIKYNFDHGDKKELAKSQE